MRVRHHVVVLEPQTASVLLEWQRGAWLLPSAVAEDSLRGTEVVRGCLAHLKLSGVVRWMEPVAFEIVGDELQMLSVVDASPHAGQSQLVPHALREVDLTRALVQSQAIALSICRDGLAECQSGSDFKHVGTWEALDRWICGALDRLELKRTGPAHQYTATARECTMAIPTNVGTVHFKGLAGRPSVEASVGQYFSAQWPQYAPRTHAYDRERGWWLTACAPGLPIADTMTLHKGLAVVEALASLQAETRPHLAHLERLGCAGVDLDALEERTQTLLTDARDDLGLRLTDEMLEALAHRDWVAEALREAVATLKALSPPLTWLHTDLAGSNVFFDAGRVTFIDFAGPAIGPAPTALYSFLHHLPSYVPRARLIREGWTTQLKRRYAQTWAARGWDGADATFRAAKIVLYAIRTERLLRLPQQCQLTSGGDVWLEVSRGHAAARFTQAVWATRRASAANVSLAGAESAR